MRLILSILLKTLRHAFVGLAVVSVLMMTLPIQLHAQVDNGHDHGVALSIEPVLDDELGESDDPNVDDPDGCGHCHCSTSSMMIADSAAFALHDPEGVLARLGHPTAIPDSLSYPPDTPPVRLS